MNSTVLDSLTTWARRACGKADARMDVPHHEAGDTTAFRLIAWPELPDLLRTAPVYRLLSVMTVRAVSRSWMLAQSRLQAHELDALLARLQASGELVQEATPTWTPRVRHTAPSLFAA